MTEHKIQVLIVTGLSGSGKSTAIKAFEDLNFFCIDNLPVPLLPHFLTLCEHDMPDIHKVALGIDIRERAFLKAYDHIFSSLEEAGYRLEILFFEASTDVLQRRYSQTRRLHPMALSAEFLGASIRHERKALRALRDRASRIVDTSSLSVHQLKDLIIRGYSLVGDIDLMRIQVLSFGYKYGVPLEADLVSDVRFLPNPYFVERLRPLNGTSEAVREWVLNHSVATEFIQDYGRLLVKLMPRYIEERKRYLTIAIGCTGGKHRSVVIAGQLADELKDRGYNVILTHRDIFLD